MKKIFIVFCIIMIISGCASKQIFLIDDVTEPKASNIIINKINILDMREGVTDRLLELPFLSWPGQYDKIKPALSRTHENIIETEILKYITNKGINVDIVVYVEEGYKEFRATWAGEVEHVETKLKINLHDGVHTPYLLSLSAISFYEVTSMDASHDYIEKLFQKSIRSCIRKAFQDVPEIINSKKNVNNIIEMQQI